MTADIQQLESNWGFCKPLVKMGDKISYTIEVFTFNSDPKFFTKSAVSMKLIGLDVTEYFFFSESGIQSDYVKLSTDLDYIGDVETIELKLKGVDDWTCKNILITTPFGQFNFTCYQTLQPLERYFLDVNGSKEYTITTYMNDSNSCASLVRAKILGKKNSSPWFTVDPDGFKPGEIGLMVVKATDVGMVAGLMVDKEELNVNCVITAIKLSYLNFEDNKTEYWKWETESTAIVSSIYLKFPVMEQMAIDTNPEVSTEGVKEAEESTNPEFLPFAEHPFNEQLGILDVNLDLANRVFDGTACLVDKEAKSVVDITCENSVKDLLGLFQIDENGIETFEFPNYMQKLMRCPKNCNFLKLSDISPDMIKKGITTKSVLGLGIHPYDTPICLAGIVDNAIPVNGGVLNVSVAPGLDLYSAPMDKYFYGIAVQSAIKSNLSYYVNKVDNVNMISNSVRVLDSHEHVNSYGRVEIRTIDTWHSICGESQHNERNANMLCQAAGYLSGALWTPYEEKIKHDPKLASCGDYCANSYMNKAGIICPEKAETLYECQIQNFVKCSSNRDLLVRCYDYPAAKGIPDFTNNSTITGKDRYYPGFYYDNKPSFLCSGALRNNEATAFCKGIGFNNGGSVAAATEGDVEYKATKGNFVQNVYCPLNSKSLNKKCRVIRLPSDYTCNDSYQVVNCNGPRVIVPDYIAPIVTPLRLPFPKYVKANCDTDAVALFGDPGSSYIVRCPENCNQGQGKVYGTTVFSEFSSMCVAGIQTGVMFASQNSLIQVTLNFPLMEVKDKSNFNIKGMKLQKVKKTFTVSKPNSCSLIMTQIMNDSLASFMQVGASITTHKYKHKHWQYSGQNSFIRKLNYEFLFIQTALKVNMKMKMKTNSATGVRDMLKFKTKTRTKTQSQSLMKASESRFERRLKYFYFSTFKRIPDFIYSPPASELLQFNGKNVSFNCKLLQNAYNSTTLGTKFTIIFGLKTTKCPARGSQTVFTTGSGGYELLLVAADKRLKCRLVFQKYGTNNKNAILDPGYRPRMMEDFIGYAIVFYYGTIKFYANGELKYVQHHTDMNGIDGEYPLHIGSDPNKADRYFEGGFKYFAKFQYVLSEEEILKINIRGVKPVPRPVILSNQRFTVEGKPCVSNCLPGAPNYAKYEVKSNKTVGNHIQDQDLKDSNEELGKEKEEAEKEEVKISHQVRMMCTNSLEFYMKIKFPKGIPSTQAKVTYFCPADCLLLKSDPLILVASKTVNGRTYFSDTSSICLAAIYEGLDISNGNYFMAHFQVDTDPQVFMENTQNQVKTWQISKANFIFYLEYSEPIFTVNNTENLKSLVSEDKRFNKYYNNFIINPSNSKFKMSFKIECVNYPLMRYINRKKNIILYKVYKYNEIFSENSNFCDSAFEMGILPINVLKEFRVTLMKFSNEHEFKTPYKMDNTKAQLYDYSNVGIVFDKALTNVEIPQIDLSLFSQEFSQMQPNTIPIEQNIVPFKTNSGQLALIVDKLIIKDKSDLTPLKDITSYLTYNKFDGADCLFRVNIHQNIDPEIYYSKYSNNKESEGESAGESKGDKQFNDFIANPYRRVPNTSIFYNENQKFVILFRYQSFEENLTYYSVEISKKEIILKLLMDGENTQLMEYKLREELRMNVVYRFALVLEKSTAKLYLNSGSDNDYQEVLNFNELIVDRGKVAVGVVGGAGLVISDMRIDGVSEWYKREHLFNDLCSTVRSAAYMQKECDKYHVPFITEFNYCKVCCEKTNKFRENTENNRECFTKCIDVYSKKKL